MGAPEVGGAEELPGCPVRGGGSRDGLGASTGTARHGWLWIHPVR